MEHIYNFASENAMLLNTVILAITYVFIVWEKISKVTVVLLGAAATLFFGLLATTKTGDNLAQYFTNYIDFNVIFLLIAMMMVVHISAASGIYTWAANEFVKMTKGHPKSVYFVLAIFTAFISAFLDNVTTVILVMPITFAVCKMLDIDPVPFLIGEILCSNIGGTATLIGDPPNIIIGFAAGLSFMDFIKELTGIVVLICLAAVFILIFVFRKKLVANKRKMARVRNIDNSNTITNKPLAIRSCVVLAFIVLGFVTHDITHIPVFLIAMIGAAILLIFENPAKVLEHVEWNTIFFFVGLFIIIGGVQASGGIDVAADLLIKLTHGSQKLTSMLVLWVSAATAGIVGNIPYTITITPVISQMQAEFGTLYTYPIWWALALGACLGGNLTIIGAAANVIVVEAANKEGYHISFMKFFKYGASITLVAICMSTGYLYLRFFMK